MVRTGSRKHKLGLSWAARRALAETLPESVAAAVWQFVRGRCSTIRIGWVSRCGSNWRGTTRRGAGQYRVVYRIDEREVIVDVIKIPHRSDAYS